MHQEFSPDARILSINFKLEWSSGDSLVDQILVIPAEANPALGKTARALLRVISRRFPRVGTGRHRNPSSSPISSSCNISSRRERRPT